MRFLLLLGAIGAGLFVLWTNMPLSWLWSYSDIESRDVHASEISGTIWNGNVRNLQIGQFKAGDIQLALKETPWPGQPVTFAVGRPDARDPDFALNMQPLSGELTLSNQEIIWDGDIISADISEFFAPIPVEPLVIRDAHIAIAKEKCVMANGVVTTGVDWNMAIWTVKYQLQGQISCAGDDVYCNCTARMEWRHWS